MTNNFLNPTLEHEFSMEASRRISYAAEILATHCPNCTQCKPAWDRYTFKYDALDFTRITYFDFLLDFYKTPIEGAIDPDLLTIFNFTNFYG